MILKNVKYDFWGFFMTLTLQFDLDYGQNSTKWMHILIILAHTVILSYRWAKSVSFDLQLISENKPVTFSPDGKNKWVKIEIVQKNRPHVELYFMPRRIVRLARFLRF